MATTLRMGEWEVPRIGLGTNRLQDTAEHAVFVRDAIAAGIRHIDTAHLYSDGRSEAAIGAALASGRPDGVVVATKGGYHDGRPETIAREIEESRRRLRVERIDLYYLHRVHDDVGIEDSLEVIVRERDRGRIAHIGVSNVDLAQLARARQVTEIAAVQNHFNLAHREHDDVLDLCGAEGIAFVPYFPLRDETPALHEVAARHDATPAQAALAWLLHRSPTTLPIPGTLSLAHVRENLATLELALSEADLAALDASG
jgi:pyridoxine 4-dehydrogenase